jgi:hypothetical protein
MKKTTFIFLSFAFLFSADANAWFFFWIPIPSGSKSNSTSPAVPSSNMPNGGQAQQLNNIKPTESPAAPIAPPALNQPITTPEPTPIITAIKPEKKVEPADLNSGQSLATKKLIELKSLLDKGLINQKDYDSKKTEILKSM